MRCCWVNVGLCYNGCSRLLSCIGVWLLCDFGLCVGNDGADLVGFVWMIVVVMYSGTIGCLSLLVWVA